MTPDAPEWFDISGTAGVAVVPKDNTLPELPTLPVVCVPQMGPTGLSNNTDGLRSKWWLLSASGNMLTLHKQSGGVWEAVLDLEVEGSVKQLALTFDQLGRPIIGYVILGVLKLWWYNPVVEGQVTTTVTTASSLALGFDMPDTPSDGQSDAILAYVREGHVYWRLQRDRWAVEYDTGVEKDQIMVTRAVRSEDFRFQIEYRHKGD